ncbi:MAG: efflux RND transporter periplasmic adaptor subunit [Candidatus Krumholzibacteriia bacterium]
MQNLRSKSRRRGALAASTPALLLLFALFTSACDRGGAGERAPGRVTPAVEAVQARHGALPLQQRLSGVVTARNRVDIYPQISAVIAEVLVETGDAVSRGQPLVRLRETEFRERLKQVAANHQIAVAQLRRAEALAKEARAEYERLQALTAQDLASQAELEAAEAQTESAAADVQLAEARVEQALASVQEQQETLTQTVIRAPVAGRVGNRNAEVGMLASPSTRLFVLGQLDTVRVDVVLTDRMLGSIAAGQRVEVTTRDSTITARLSRISPFLHPVAHSTHAEIDVPNPGEYLKAGMFVTVDIFHGESEEATLIPLSALYENPATGAVGVYVAQAPLDRTAADELGTSPAEPLPEPVPFAFVPVRLIAQGRMAAAVHGVDADAWVVTLGQNLLGGAEAEARVRPVSWGRIERLQRLQREDLMQEVVQPTSTH